MPKRAYYIEETRFHELNNLAERCVVLSFSEKRGLTVEDITGLLANFREVVEMAMSDDDYDDLPVKVYPVHNGNDPEFLCCLGAENLSDEDVEEVYEFLLGDDEDEDED